MKLRFFAVGASALLVLSFQNCSKVGFGAAEDSLLSSSLSMTDTLVETNMNTPVEFETTHSGSLTTLHLSFESANSGMPLNGQIEVIDAASFKFKYTPNFGYRGKDLVVATVKDKFGNETKFFITVIVGNALHALEPALAVRGMGCIQCHAQVASNIITDFGYKDAYYFGQTPDSSWWKSGGIYGDHGNNFKTMALPADKSVVVPKAELPPIVAAAQGLSTLGDYLRSQLSQSETASTRGAKVLEKSSVFIGAPREADITAAFKLADGERAKYFKNSDHSTDLSGLLDQGRFFQNKGVLNCEGDLAIRGPLLLDNLELNSKTGCRLYVIGSVFMYGPITYVNNDADSNLQITSTRSISMGLGSAVKDGVLCEPTGHYKSATSGYGLNSLTNRHATFWTVPGNHVRQNGDPKAFGASVVAEADVIAAKAGPLYDASCRNEGRNVSFEKILLNAPVVHSRYEGNISGTIIAEFSLMSLGKFKFSFDQVFTKVPVLPFIDQGLYLEVKN